MWIIILAEFKWVFGMFAFSYVTYTELVLWSISTAQLCECGISCALAMEVPQSCTKP